jgi:cytochrome c oxidase subunit IV
MPNRLTMVLVWGALLALLAATIGVSQLRLGLWNPVLNLSIAAIKTLLVAWLYMDLRTAPPVARLFGLGLILWLTIMFGLGIPDWLTR